MTQIDLCKIEEEGEAFFAAKEEAQELEDSVALLEPRTFFDLAIAGTDHHSKYMIYDAEKVLNIVKGLFEMGDSEGRQYVERIANESLDKGILLMWKLAPENPEPDANIGDFDL